MEYKIENSKEEDLDTISNLIYSRCVWFKEKNIPGWDLNFYPNKYNKNYFKEQMQKNKLFVAKANNKVCGVMLLKEEDSTYWPDNESSYYIHHLVTDIKLKGVGKKLIIYAIDQCKKENKKFLRLDCYQKSQFLNEYYKKLGFINVGKGTNVNYKYNLWEMKIS